MPSNLLRFDRVRFPVQFYGDLIEQYGKLMRVELISHMSTSGMTDLSTEAGVDNYIADWPSGSGMRDHQSITNGNSTWTFASVTDLLKELRHPYDAMTMRIYSGLGVGEIKVSGTNDSTHVVITATERRHVERLAKIFTDAAPQFERQIEVERPSIFLGHGGSPQWRELSDYLHHQMGYEVEAFETLPRAGHTIKEVLAGALANANLAIIVMTAEDEQSDLAMRARQNVVHEVGLFQGHLGFARTLVALESGTDDFSNIAGLQQLRYPAGQIRAIFGDIVATIKREFPANTPG